MTLVDWRLEGKSLVLFPLVPKLHLGTHFPAKLHFALIAYSPFKT